MSKNIRWLQTEVERWVGEAIINPAQAARIRALYPEANAGAAWGLIVFFGIGSIVVGLGVILLFAYNWNEIPKAAKLALILGATAGAHGAGLVLRQKLDWRASLGEGLSLLGTMLFGAGIWLVAQIYHIDEHFPNGFLFWGLGALAMAWALPSVGQAILATVTLTIWACVEVVEFNTATDISSLVLLVGVGGLVWRFHSAILTAVMVGGLYATLLFNAGGRGDEQAVFLTALSFSALLVASGTLVHGTRLSGPVATVLRGFGLSGVLMCAYLLSFHDMADNLVRSVGEGVGSDPERAVYSWVVGGLALGAWVWAAVRVRRGERDLVRLEEWLFPAGLVFAQVYALAGERGDARLVASVFNLIILCVGAMWAVRGCREGRLRPVVLGTLMIAALVLARYFDLFESLALRGLVFVACGAALFAEGFYYRRHRPTGDAGRTSP